MPGARWFEGATLNFAANLLRRSDSRHRDRVPRTSAAQRRELTYADLRDEVARRRGRAARGSASARAIASRASAESCPRPSSRCSRPPSLGAIWSSCSPDFGIARRARSLRADRAEGAVHGRRLLLRRQDASTRWPRSAQIARAAARAARSRRRAVSRRATRADRRACRDAVATGRLRSAPQGEARVRRRCRSTIRSTSCIPPAPPACRNASCTARAARCSSIEGARAAHRHRARRPRVLLHDVRLDDVELARARRSPSGATLVLYDGSPLHPDPRRAVATRRARAHRRVRHEREVHLAALEKSGVRAAADASSSPRCAPCFRPARRSRLRASTSSTAA